MKKLFTIAILGLIISAPAWAEQVYTNSSLRKFLFDYEALTAYNRFIM
ncbi:MAG: hypothetical protein U9N63_13685 [Pseudomonadota bacterium]|nr:hypothetical protein [Pseudomonadota bacterium]